MRYYESNPWKEDILEHDYTRYLRNNPQRGK